ncbi:MAG: 23S rRNA (guanosine(2251)-2'-O)-methyltransferase RlmB, partial [Elusimicrobia bacterium RIFOXYB2_FULL_49_7]
KGIPLHHVPPERLDVYDAEHNQGVIAEVAAAAYLDLDDLWREIKDKENPFVVVLDGIEDPHNVGAIIRSSVAFGAHGIIMGKWRATGLTETVARTSAGAIEHIPVARVTNIAQSIERLKELGLWVCGAEAGYKDIRTERFTFPLALVIGSEGKGLHRLVRERCDFLVSIPFTSTVSSLNASCAAAVVLYEVYSQLHQPSAD